MARFALLLLVPLLAGAGPARVVDGDTLELEDGQGVRLWGIDAPEGSQECQRAGRPWRCGDDAAVGVAGVAVIALVRGKMVRCS